MPLGDQIKGDEMGKACSTYGGEKIRPSVVVRKYEGNTTLGKL